MSEVEDWQLQFYRLGFLRMTAFALLLSLVSLLFGFSFFLIFLGLFFFFVRVAPFHVKTYSILAALLRIDFDPKDYVAPPFSPRRILFIIAISSIWLILTAVGVRELVATGFLGQNFIYLFFCR